MRERRITRAQLEKVDARVARVAAGQHHVVTLDQLHECGMSDGAITWRVQSGRLFPYFRSVYAVVPKLAMEGVFLAAVKACGWGATLSRSSTSALYGWCEWDGRAPEVVAPTLRRHPGIRTYRSEWIERTTFRGIPVTTPARTIIDLSADEPYERLRRQVNEALNQRRITPRDLVTSGHRGAKKLRAILKTAAPTRSEFEDIVLASLDGLPRPEVNRANGRYVPDFRWPEFGVILEADSVRFHDHLLARADDAERQAVLERRGDTVVRTTWAEITTRPGAVVARVRGAMAASVDLCEYSARMSTLARVSSGRRRARGARPARRDRPR
jgi:very-short-patch-repair endonuclease